VIEHLPERYRNAATARAITAPSAILLAGVGTSAAVLGGIPLAGAALVGAACWAGRVALGLPRQPKAERIDPMAVRDPWRRFVREAVAARDRFDRAVADADPGPLRDRLAEMAAQVSVGATEVWRVARRGNALEAAVAELDVDDTRSQLRRCQEESARSPERSELVATEKALRSQLESAERLGVVAAGARDRLARIDAQLDEAVARALELSLQTGDTGDLGPLGSAVDNVVGELESLRQALEESRP